MHFAKKISSPLGPLFLVATEQALIALDNVASELYQKASKTETHPILNLASGQLQEYFQGKRHTFELPLKPDGTAFQQQAWQALCQIPYGEVWSYGQQAKYLKAPKASRAVGGANGKNPIPIIIPCHRVIGSTGKLTGYSGGMEMKIGLLKHEGHQIDGLQLVN